jgi:hypothetical protein
LIWDARLSSLDWVRETRTRLKPLRAICRANSLPMPSDAPVMTAQLPFLPKLESLTCQHEDSIIVYLHTEVPGRTNVLNKNRNVVKAIEAIVKAPTPSKAALEIVCWPSGPRSSVIILAIFVPNLMLRC